MYQNFNEPPKPTTSTSSKKMNTIKLMDHSDLKIWEKSYLDFYGIMATNKVSYEKGDFDVLIPLNSKWIERIIYWKGEDGKYIVEWFFEVISTASPKNPFGKLPAKFGGISKQELEELINIVESGDSAGSEYWYNWAFGNKFIQVDFIGTNQQGELDLINEVIEDIYGDETSQNETPSNEVIKARDEKVGEFVNKKTSKVNILNEILKEHNLKTIDMFKEFDKPNLSEVFKENMFKVRGLKEMRNEAILANLNLEYGFKWQLKQWYGYAKNLFGVDPTKKMNYDFFETIKNFNPKDISKIKNIDNYMKLIFKKEFKFNLDFKGEGKLIELVNSKQTRKQIVKKIAKKEGIKAINKGFYNSYSNINAIRGIRQTFKDLKSGKVYNNIESRETIRMFKEYKKLTDIRFIEAEKVFLKTHKNKIEWKIFKQGDKKPLKVSSSKQELQAFKKVYQTQIKRNTRKLIIKRTIKLTIKIGRFFI